MYVKIRRRHHANHTYEYVDIVESVRIDGKIVRRRLGTLGQRQDLPPHKIDALIGHLRKLASPQGLHGVQLGEIEIRAVREYGVTLVAHHLWQQLGLDELLGGLTQSRSVPVSEALFRMVVNRLLAKVFEQRLRQAGLTLSVAHALETLKRLQAVEHTWEDQAIVVKATRPDPEAVKILAALDLRIDNPVLQVTRITPPTVDDATVTDARA